MSLKRVVITGGNAGVSCVLIKPGNALTHSSLLNPHQLGLQQALELARRHYAVTLTVRSDE